MFPPPCVARFFNGPRVAANIAESRMRSVLRLMRLTISSRINKARLSMNLLHKSQRIKDFFTHLIRHFIDDRCIESAGVLAYTSLLSLVPLLAVSFTLFSAFPAFAEFTDKILDFVVNAFVPANREIVESHLRNFVEKASTLTLPGLIGLLITALLSIATIEKTFNAIWKVNRRRNLMDAFMVYWSVLTLGPLLVGVSLAVTSYVVSLSFFSDAARGIEDAGVLLKLLPFFAAALAFTLLYATVPYQRVSIRHAMVGGIVAAGLFELAKEGFVLFITHFPTYEVIYGALATLPIFLIWIYLFWLIVLLGAEFTYCLGKPDPNSTEAALAESIDPNAAR
uniref:UPF0761 membrane protein BECKLPF1236A_GA0070988_102482 n=1 Tax=Candidatus Kentrum sp. LPFa TaxID=2126335 RepID=A0A450WSY9_9GAMM|nr:MAG: membrane protein [Candidatus Kentron sp. LPFa]VFK34433.1 MAG: membrane protein [Candidatus Kentron sp. LPFa]